MEASMRLWSIHPEYLDRAGLLALWREALLAQAVLRGRTFGYRNHPQLERFQKQPEPQAAIAVYLQAVWEEAAQRGYRFDRAKIGPLSKLVKIEVTRGQLEYEWCWLRQKLERRDVERCRAMQEGMSIKAHPLFVVVPGPVADWEKVKEI
jgi:hypothetical protein